MGMPKNAKNGQKCKNPKSGQLKIDPCPSPIPTPTQKMPKKAPYIAKKDGLSENPPKKHKNALFSLGSQRNNFNFTYSESARRDDFGKVGHLYGPFFCPGSPSGTMCADST